MAISGSGSDPMVATFSVKHAGAWKAPVGVHVKHVGVWKAPVGAFIKNGGVWQQYWPKGPVNTVAPTITGSVYINQEILVSNHGTWSETPTSYTYQWYADATALPGRTTLDYYADFNDIGKMIHCKVVAINANGSSVPVASNSIGPMQGSGERPTLLPEEGSDG